MLRVLYAPSQTFEVAKQRSAADWLVPTAVAALGFCFVSEAKITQQIPGGNVRRRADSGIHEYSLLTLQSTWWQAKYWVACSTMANA